MKLHWYGRGIAEAICFIVILVMVGIFLDIVIPVKIPPSDYFKVIEIVESKEPECVKLRLLKNFDVNSIVRETEVTTPLKYMIMKNNIEGVKILLLAGANPSIKHNGMDAREFAVRLGREEIVRILK